MAGMHGTVSPSARPQRRLAVVHGDSRAGLAGGDGENAGSDADGDEDALDGATQPLGGAIDVHGCCPMLWLVSGPRRVRGVGWVWFKRRAGRDALHVADRAGHCWRKAVESLEPGRTVVGAVDGRL